MPKLGIVTVLYRSNDLLEGFIKSISLQDYKDYELYLIDNSASAETDRIIGELSKKYPVNKLVHIKNEFNLGAAAGNNVGIERALQDDNDVVLMTNTDIRFDDRGLLSKTMQVFASSNEKIVVPKIFTANKEKVWMAGAGFNNLLAKAIHYGYEKNDSVEYGISRYVKYAPTTFMFIKKDVFANIGLLDEKYFAYFEDTDFVFRCTSKGYQVYYWPEVNVEHLVSYTTGGISSVFTLYYGTRNRIYFSIKNLPGYKWFVTIPYILVITFFRMFGYNASQRKATIKGIVEGFKLSRV